MSEGSGVSPAEPAREVRRSVSGRTPGIGAPGRNCICVCTADRLAVLVDAAEYYRRLHQSLCHAQHSVFLVGWDLDSRVELIRDGSAGDLPTRFGDLLNHLVRRRRDLRVYVVAWDFATIFALEREPLTIFRLGWHTHRRIHFRYDAKHPFGASHHQKAVVIDDRVAYVGGLDVTAARWDTPEHLPDDPRRIDRGDQPYKPFHDVQVVLSGEAALAVAKVARERWRRVSHLRATPRQATPGPEDPWPDDLTPELTDARVLVARTHPEFGGRPAIREVEQLYFDSIAAARRSIYIENQYFTAASVCQVLAARLAEEDGPEIVIVLPKVCAGWLEKRSMGYAREILLRQLQDADAHGRLRLLHPVSGPDQDIYVHSKVMVVDDVLLRIGSSNVTNRSLGMDTELDVLVEARDERERAFVRATRDRLLAEHLGVAPEEVAGAIAAHGSIRAAVDRLAGNPRTLKPLPPDEACTALPGPARGLADPERPTEVTLLLDQFLPEIEEEQRSRVLWLVLAAVSGVALVLAVLARDPAFVQRIPSDEFRGLIALAPPPPAALWLVAAAFTAGTLVFISVNLLIVATIMAYGALAGSLLALTGTLVAAVVGFGVGRLLGRSTVRTIVGRRVNRLSRKLSRSGVMAVLLVRIVPVAPSAVVNLVCGATRIRFADFARGTLFGTLPGVAALAVLGGQLRAVLQEPRPAGFALLAVTAAALLWIARWIRGFLADHDLGLRRDG